MSGSDTITTATPNWQATEDPAPPPTAGKIREEERLPYPYVQSVALMKGDRTPTAADFRPMQFQDLSQSGCSYFATTPPTTPQIVVELGQKPMCIYMIARVVRCERDPQDPQRRYRVGCHFAKRMAAVG